MPPRGGEGSFVDGPSVIEIVGRTLYVDEMFGRVLRSIDLDTGRSRRIPVPSGVIMDLRRSADGTLILHGEDQAWRLDATGALVAARQSDVGQLDGPLRPQLPASVGARVGDSVQGPSGEVFFTTSSEYATGRRIWRLIPGGTPTTFVGPWARIVGDPRQHGASWYPKSLGALVLDGRGALWFLDRGRHMILRAELSSGVVTFVQGGAIDPSPWDPYGLQSAGEFTDLAADTGGNIYAADYGGQRVVRIDRGTGRLTRIARVGGSREQGISDGWGEVAEPERVTCAEHARSGTAVIEVVDSQGGAIPGAEVFVLGATGLDGALRADGAGGVEATIRTDAAGHASLAIPTSRSIRAVILLPGFDPAVTAFKASEGCTSTVRVELTVGPMRSHRMG